MSQQADRHPNPQQLSDFSIGKLTADETALIAAHLERCSECSNALRSSGNDSVIETGRIAPGSDVPRTSTPGNETSDAATLLVSSSADTAAVELTDELPDELLNHPRYQIVGRIGRGGMGDVYRAQHRLMNRAVALKLINSRLVQNPQAIERFRREVQTAAQLAHPNIVTAHDAEKAGDVHFLVMEFVDGVDLASVVRERGPLPVDEACEYICQAAEGLQHAYEKGMVHRDIKPHNLMVVRREASIRSPETDSTSALSSSEHDTLNSGVPTLDSIKILDFGLAGFATEAAFEEAEVTATEPGSGPTPLHLTTIGTVMGTPDYIAPEQARDAHSADIRADIYSLGCTLCFLLTGKPPFAGDSVLNKLKAHQESERPSLDHLRDDVPAELAAVIRRMMATDPADRPQTPGAVTEALSRWTSRTVAVPTGEQPVQIALKKTRSAFAAAIICLAVVAVFLIYRTGDRERSGRAPRLAKGRLQANANSKPAKRKPQPRGALQRSPVPLAATWKGHTAPVKSIAVSRDGDFVASVSGWPVGDNTVRLWQAADGTALHVLHGHRDKTLCVAFTPNGDRVLSGSADGSVRIWSVLTGKAEKVIQVGRPVEDLVVDQSGGFFLMVAGSRVARRNLTDPDQPAWSFNSQEKPMAIDLSPAGDRFLTGNNEGGIGLWDAGSGKSIARHASYPGFVEVIRYAPDGASYFVGGHGNSVTQVDADSGKLLREFPAPYTRDIAVSGDGQRIAAAMANRAAIIEVSGARQFELMNGFAGDRYGFWTVEFAADGRRLFGAGGSMFDDQRKQILPQNDYRIRVWQMPEATSSE